MSIEFNKEFLKEAKEVNVSQKKILDLLDNLNKRTEDILDKNKKEFSIFANRIIGLESRIKEIENLLATIIKFTDEIIIEKE